MSYLNKLLNSSDQSQARLHNWIKMRQLLGDNWTPPSYDRTHLADALQLQYQNIDKGLKTDDVVRIAGRIFSIRNSGMFIDLHDHTGKIQIFSDAQRISEHDALMLSLLDLGDIIGIEGTVRRTPRGELTIDTIKMTFLAKSFLPMPHKHYGLENPEQRWRQRYVDIMVNDDARHTLRQRFKILHHMRNMLHEFGFMEVETPMLHPIAGGALAKPFQTHHNALHRNLFLRIAPELYLKRLIVSGISDKVFELNRCFRNEGISTRHNPEFTTLELYQAYAGMDEMINITEKIICHLSETLNATLSLTFQNSTLNFHGPWPRKSMADLVQEHTGYNFLNFSLNEAQACCTALNVAFKPEDGWGHLLAAVFEAYVEPHLVQPMHVTYLPLDISPLSQISSHDARLTDRFETYIYGWEIANGFAELNDPAEQYQRFHAQIEENVSSEDRHQMDEDFIRALAYGMPPTGGLGIGIDRLAMLLTNQATIREVIAFPILKTDV